jgi:hypothetical protein
MIPMRASVAIAFLALACGEGAPAGDTDAAVAGRASPSIALDSAVTGDSLVAVPDLLAGACIAGDPAEGEPWRLESVGLPTLEIEGIEALVARDSARLAARIARMVDVIPSDTSVADFRGLPVTVRAAWRLAVAEADTLVVALVVRRVPIESEPLEELFTIVASPGQRQGVRDPLVEGWFVREVGPEEALVARELAGAYGRANDLVLAFVEDAEGGVRAALVERRDGRWRTAWTGPLPSCPAP